MGMRPESGGGDRLRRGAVQQARKADVRIRSIPDCNLNWRSARFAPVEYKRESPRPPKERITDRPSREALAAILRELRYQRRRALELSALCDHGLARINLTRSLPVRMG